MEATNSINPEISVSIISFFQSSIFFLAQIFGLFFLSFVIYETVSRLFFVNAVKKIIHDQDLIVLLIKISSRNEQKESSMEDFLRSMHRLLPNNTKFSLEMASQEQFLRFYITIPKYYRNILESQLYAQYSECEIEEISEYLPEFDNNTAFAEISFKKQSIHPINTYKNLQEDLLKNLSAIMSKTENKEQIVLQFSLKKIGSKILDRGIKGLLFKINGKKYQTPESPTPSYYKYSQDLFEGKLRVAYKSSNKLVSRTKLNALLGLLKSVKSIDNELKKTLKENLSKLFLARTFYKGDFWTPAEIATIYHFPYRGDTTSNIVNTTSKRAPAPDILPKEGLIDPSEISFIGTTNFRNENKKFGIKRIDRRRHLYVIGKTGSGKSKLLELLLLSDIQSRQGCCLIDPHGDLAEEILKYVPKERINDVVYINPADTDFPIGFNPLEPVEDYQVRQHLSVFFISIFKKLFAASWNARMEHLIRYITLALLETPDSNVLGIPRILSDIAFRQRVIMQIKDPVVKGFWTNEFSASVEQYSREAVVPILNKVGQFISNPVIRNMVGQRKNMLDFAKFMDQGKIVIINLSKGKIGDDNAALLGSMFITKIQQAALARAKVPEEQRRDFYFYVDEFQNFATDAFSSILSEARKYHLDLTIAHQYIAQLPDEVKATAFGNVGSIITFAVGGDDANYLEKEFAPTFTAEDLINLNSREMYLKMSIDGRLTPPFSAKTLDMPKNTADYKDEILSHSKLTFGRNKIEVENEIKMWSESTDGKTPMNKSDEFPDPII